MVKINGKGEGIVRLTLSVKSYVILIILLSSIPLNE